MADEPSPRAKFNASLFFVIGLTVFAAVLTCWGLATGNLDWEKVATQWITGAIASLATWAAMK